jgi:hypothetical protein
MVVGLMCLTGLSIGLVAESPDSPPQTSSSQEPSAPTEPPRRALPAPLDPIFPAQSTSDPLRSSAFQTAIRSGRCQNQVLNS